MAQYSDEIRTIKSFDDNRRLLKTEIYMPQDSYIPKGNILIESFKRNKIYNKSFYYNGKLHRDNGPAIINYDTYTKQDFTRGHEEYYFINGINITEKVLKWHKDNNIELDKITEKQKILRKIQIGI